jgi:hypothetical protein
MKNFIFKTIVITLAILFVSDLVLPEIPKIPRNEREKLFLLSFVQNPSVLWKLSLAQEEKGNIKDAIMYMELSIGLMEMHGASDKSLKKYTDRIDSLRKINN